MSVTFIALLAEPTEFIVTLRTSHVLTTSIFIYKHTTGRTSHCEQNLFKISPLFSFAFTGHVLPPREARWIPPAVITFLTFQRLFTSLTIDKATICAIGGRTYDDIVCMSQVLESVELFDLVEESRIFDLLSEFLVRNISATSVRTADQGIGGQILTIEYFLNPVRHTILTTGMSTVEMRERLIVQVADGTLLDLSQKLKTWVGTCLKYFALHYLILFRGINLVHLKVDGHL